MPESGSIVDPLYTNRKWHQRLLRWSLLGICWTSYIVYRGLVIGQIKYDLDLNRFVIYPRYIRTKLFARALLLTAIYHDYLLYFSFILVFLPLLPGTECYYVDNKAFVVLFVSIIMQVLFWNTAQMLIFLRSLTWNRSFVQIANEVIQVVASMKDLMGPVHLEGLYLLIIFGLLLILAALHIITMIPEQRFFIMFNLVLLMIFFSVYVAYQLLLLCWVASFTRYLEFYLRQPVPNKKQHSKLLQIMRLYSRISNNHFRITKLWLPISRMIFSDILMLIIHWGAVFKCILFNHEMDAWGKWIWLLRYHISGCLAPLLRMLFIGLCSNHLAKLERLLSLQLLGIDLRNNQLQDIMEYKARYLVSDFTFLQLGFDLQLRAQPIRNKIMNLHHVCDSQFVLEFIICLLLNSLNCVQHIMNFKDYGED
ncbi:hypothetical protein KR009_008646, partial [Drosophila setifemur]